MFLNDRINMLLFIISELMMFFVTPKGDHRLSQRYSELYLNTLFKPLRWLSKKCRRQDLNSQPQRPLSDLIPSLMLQTARFYTRLYYHAQTRAHNLLRQKVITLWVSAIVSYILTNSHFEMLICKSVIQRRSKIFLTWAVCSSQELL